MPMEFCTANLFYNSIAIYRSQWNAFPVGSSRSHPPPAFKITLCSAQKMLDPFKTEFVLFQVLLVPFFEDFKGFNKY